MIKEIHPKEYDSVYKFAEKDIARNYFILLGLKSKKIYGISYKMKKSLKRFSKRITS